MTAEELARPKNYLAEHPDAGDLIAGTGGARRFRFAPTGRGKRGGSRIITLYCADDIPVFLMDVFAKGEKMNSSACERAELKQQLGSFADEYRAMVGSKATEKRKSQGS